MKEPPLKGALYDFTLAIFFQFCWSKDLQIKRIFSEFIF